MIDMYTAQSSCLLADQMGLGKTIQAISFLGYLKDIENCSGPHIIIAPLSTLDNWKKEVESWLPSFKTILLYNRAEEREIALRKFIIPQKFDIVITNYEAMSVCLNYLDKIKFKCLILDEAHRIKNDECVFAQDLRLMKCQIRILLTGTPIHNNIYELWSLLNFLMPKLFKDKDLFV